MQERIKINMILKRTRKMSKLPDSPFKQAWNMQGVKVDTLTAKGLLIYEYESGVRKKIFKR